MTTYLLNTTLESARKAVSRFIERRRGPLRLGLLTSYAPCGLLGKHLPHGETRHDLTDGRRFTLYHLFVPVLREVVRK
jgi:hypothetical protein